MLIVCPACASEYTIDTDRVGAEGRSVRCAACRETWFITPGDVVAARAAEAPEPTSGRADDQAALDAWEAALADEGLSSSGPDTAEPEPAVAEPAPRPSRAKPPARPRRLAGFSPSAAIGLAVLAALPLAVIGRSTVVRAMPQSAGLYARIGLPVNLRGLDLRDVVAFQTQGEDGQGQLVIEGDVVGVAPGSAPVPPIEVEVRDAQDQPLYRWTVAPPRPALENRESARFRASLSAPPKQGRSVQVRFAAAKATAEDAVSASKGDGGHGRP